MAGQNIKNILDEIVRVLNPRVRAVIEKRFGLKSETYQTLEAIGGNLGITRERVRQIEALGLKNLSNKNVLEPLKPVFEVAEKHLKEHGGIRREDYLLKELADVFGLSEKNRANVIHFILTLGKDRFSYFKETDDSFAAWALNGQVYNAAASLADGVRKNLLDKNTPVSWDNILKIAGNLRKDDNDAEKVLISYIGLSKHVLQNPFGEWGLKDSPEVSPKGVKDKAYLIFKKEKRPLHFEEVSQLINKAAFSEKKAHPQTVHNELIKDPRFVLVGRGTYALSDWGYEPGTVRDVLVSLLKKSYKGLTKEEIIGAVRSKRLVKENTVLLNLQNKKLFKKDNDGRFTLA